MKQTFLTLPRPFVCALLSEELGIDPEGIYVKYEEVAHWGYNNFNF